VVIGSMVKCHTHGFGVYFHVFGVCPRVWYELQRPRSESSIYASKAHDWNESFMDQRPRSSPTKMDYRFLYQDKPQAHHTTFTMTSFTIVMLFSSQDGSSLQDTLSHIIQRP